MSLNKNIKKILIIGSGPIIIGQAAEFDYSGTQACKAIREEGIKTVLVNSNPATIMTDMNMADKVYIEPLDVDVIKEIIKKEKPDGILAGFGGQTALNIAMELEKDNFLSENNVKLLGTHSDTIKKAEDREAFKCLMNDINEPVPKSTIANNIDECLAFAKEEGYPLIIRPAYTLGGTGGGIAYSYEQFLEICENGLKNSPINQVLIEQSVSGWKEIEYEVIRDSKDNCIVICNMENIDPVGIHTGDSIVVAPTQTLRNKEHQMLRNASIKIIRSLKIEGGCNVQFALDPYSDKYVVIEVNPRVSRSSALASKATGYPIAKISAKIAIGYTLDELKNCVTKNSSACFEPSIDYVVIKIPKWPFDKFSHAARTLGTQMKATGEVMAISRGFESALLKAIASLEAKFTGLRMPAIMNFSKQELIEKIKSCDDERIFAISHGLRIGIKVDELYELTKIDKWFLNALKNIIDMEELLSKEKLNKHILYKAQDMGFTDEEINEISKVDLKEIDNMRKEANIYPVYKIVDTCSGEFDASTPYYYATYEKEDENVISDKEKIVVIGSGPIRIGQGIEFDYCSVHGVNAIKKAGYESIIINNNPETVSTDFDTSDKLYFEPLYIDDVMNVIKAEKPKGVILQFGGQTSINLSEGLSKRNVNILGTDFKYIDIAEDRGKLSSILKDMNIPTPKGESIVDSKDALPVANKLGYPVLVRPSYVIGGRAMKIIYDDLDLKEYLSECDIISTKHPLLIDKYIKGIEIEVDAVSDKEDILLGIMEHVEKTGVHSGDSITIYPSINLENNVINTLVDYTKKIAKELNVIGLVNIQYVYDGTNVYVIEVNPRASRSVPILSKLSNIPLVDIAVEIMLGNKLKNLSYGSGLIKSKNLYGVKFPIFSNEKIADLDIYLGPEMKSTGEVLGIDEDLDVAIYKGFLSSGIKIGKTKGVYVSLKDADKLEALNIVKQYKEFGFKIYASSGNSEFLKNHGIENEKIEYSKVIDCIKDKNINIIINTPTKGNTLNSDGYKIRRCGVENKIPTFTSLDSAKLLLIAIKVYKDNKNIQFKSLDEYF